MARSATLFACSACGHESPKWHGRCPGCGEWNTFVEEHRTAAPAGRAGRSGRALRPVVLADVEAGAVARMTTGIGELDRVLGGGLVPGSLVLIGGSPGIGKSTLTCAALGNLSGAGRKVLYVSGEESAAQVRLRAERLGPAALSVPIVAETDLDSVVATIEAERPDACVIDSVQVLYDPGLSGSAGSVGQVREVAGRLMRVAKERGTAVVLVGHVTKEGSIAGPRVLEHLVDCVLSFEGERERSYRTLRALKNRFGSTSEVGVFEMHDSGLVEVEDASARFVAEATHAPGSVVLCAMEGSRPLLVEVQALVAPSELRRRGAWPMAWIATGWRSSWPSSPATAACASAGATSSSRSPEASAWRSREPISRSPWRSHPRRRGATVAPGRPLRSASSASPGSCARRPTPTAGSPRHASSASRTCSTPGRASRRWQRP